MISMEELCHGFASSTHVVAANTYVFWSPCRTAVFYVYTYNHLLFKHKYAFS